MPSRKRSSFAATVVVASSLALGACGRNPPPPPTMAPVSPGGNYAPPQQPMAPVSPGGGPDIYTRNPRTDSPMPATGQVIGNKNTNVYHLPGDMGAMPEEKNRVYFNSEQEAVSAGYHIAGQPHGTGMGSARSRRR